MKVLLHYHEWDNRWIPYFREQLSRYELSTTSTLLGSELLSLSEPQDLLICMWADPVAKFWAEYLPKKPKIVYLRRYELYSDVVPLIRWKNVDALIFISEYIRRMFEQMPVDKPRKTYMIPNCVDLDRFSLKTSPRGTKIAFLCDIRESKNFGLAFQVLLHLPQEYVLHHIGKQQVAITRQEMAVYLTNLGLEKRFITGPRIPAKDVSEWLRDKDYILSTSFTEGNPNNVLEGMAVGLKPIVHNWPGARMQFPKEYIFNTPSEAAQIILEDDYRPAWYRKYIEANYSLDNIKQIHDVIKDVLND